MRKSDAIQILGGTPAAAAAEIGISSAAIAQWPDRLPSRLIDRVQAAMFRRLIAAGADDALRLKALLEQQAVAIQKAA